MNGLLGSPFFLPSKMKAMIFYRKFAVRIELVLRKI